MGTEEKRMAAEDRLARRLQSATSIAQSDAALYDYRQTLRRIEAEEARQDAARQATATRGRADA